MLLNQISHSTKSISSVSSSSTTTPSDVSHTLSTIIPNHQFEIFLYVAVSIVFIIAIANVLKDLVKFLLSKTKSAKSKQELLKLDNEINTVEQETIQKTLSIFMDTKSDENSKKFQIDTINKQKENKIKELKQRQEEIKQDLKRK